jgi:chromate transporter
MNGETQKKTAGNWREVALIFLKLGATAFGGPAAHIALMEDEFVSRRGWLSRQQFLDLVGATNLVPGPNSTEIAIHIGKIRAGWAGFWAAGIGFIFPAFCLVLLFAWLYKAFGTLPQAQWILRGTAPVVVAIIAQALWKFAATALPNWTMRIVALLAFCGVALGAPELWMLGIAAVVGIFWGAWKHRGPKPNDVSTREDMSTRIEEQNSQMHKVILMAFLPATQSISLSLFWTFLKIGSILYGSGYVLLAFLQSEFVPKYLTQQQLLDAVTVGQITPGPLFTTATFVGFQIAGWSGAVAATVGIFLPSFFFVALLAALMEKLKNSPVARTFLDVVNAASLALMAWVWWLLLRGLFGPQTSQNIFAALLLGVSTLLLLKTKINSTWLLGAGAVLGLLVHGI